MVLVGGVEVTVHDGTLVVLGVPVVVWHLDAGLAVNGALVDCAVAVHEATLFHPDQLAYEQATLLPVL